MKRLTKPFDHSILKRPGESTRWITNSLGFFVQKSGKASYKTTFQSWVLWEISCWMPSHSINRFAQQRTIIHYLNIPKYSHERSNECSDLGLSMICEYCVFTCCSKILGNTNSNRHKRETTRPWAQPISSRACDYMKLETTRENAFWWVYRISTICCYSRFSAYLSTVGVWHTADILVVLDWFLLLALERLLNLF